MGAKCSKCGGEKKTLNRKDGSGQFYKCEQCGAFSNMETLGDVVDAVNKLTNRMDRLGALLNYIARSVEVRNKIEGVSDVVPFPEQMPPVEVDLPKTPPKVDVGGDGFPEEAPFDGGQRF